jgi:prepilin-type processing-associated H-X9-DG protein
MEFSFTIVVVGLSQDDLGGGVNGVNLLFFDGLDSLDSKQID